MTPRLTAETFCFAPAQTLASLSRVRKVVVGRRLHHRAGVHRRRPQGQGSSLWPPWAAAWPLVPRSRTLERPTSGPSGDLFQPYVTQMTG